MKQPSTETLHELQLLPQRAGDKSILALLNQTRTYGGRDALKVLLSSPCETLPQIEQRQQLLKFVTKYLDQFTIDISHSYVLSAENHLSSNLAWSSATNWLKRYEEVMRFSWFRPHDFNRLQGGTAALQIVLRNIENKTAWLISATGIPPEIQQYSGTLRAFFDDPLIKTALTDSEKPAIILQADSILRNHYRDAVEAVFQVFYQLDAYCSIASFTRTTTWTYPEFIDIGQPIFQISGLSHPLLEKSIGNNFTIPPPAVVTILTGGNMSGKTTFLKACGIAVYLAHLGLPVPAQSVQISFFDHLFTSIHLSDNLELGYSHFYIELMRIKAVADAVGIKQRVFMIADELFRGTNPQDALLCSRQVIDRLIQQTDSFFLVSSHLPEIGDTYTNTNKMQFNCFKTQVIDGRLVYNHRIESGIAREQTGLLLLKQTGVLTGLQ